MSADPIAVVTSALLAHAPLVARVGPRVSVRTSPDTATPFVRLSVIDDRETVDGLPVAYAATFQVDSVADTGPQAVAVAGLVVAALRAAVNQTHAGAIVGVIRGVSGRTLPDDAQRTPPVSGWTTTMTVHYRLP